MYKKIFACISALIFTAGTATASYGSYGEISADAQVVSQTTSTNSIDPLSAPTDDDWLHTDGGKIVDKNGNQVVLTGANWFGFNCSERMLHGLGWGADIETVISQSADRGINLFRIPVSTELLLEWKAGTVKSNYNWSNSPYYKDNPALVKDDGTAMNNLEVFDKMMQLCKKYGIKVMVDVHSAEADNSGHNYPVWYKGDITTAKWIEGWEWLVDRYKNDDTLIACDLKNEPHGKYSSSETLAAKWDDSTDENNWKYAAEKCAKAILKINPNMLIMVEGIEQTPRDGYTYESGAEDPTSSTKKYDGAWWGGNLRNAMKYQIDLGEDQDQLVYSPHDYGPLVYQQEWFKKDFSEKTLLDDYWYDSWYYLQDKDYAPLLIGEWGGFMDGADNEKYMKIMADFIAKNKISHTFWCINPNSGDTGGLLDSTWKNWDEAKYDLMKVSLWQDKSKGKFIGLDHVVKLGTDGETVSDYYGSGSDTVTPSTKDLNSCTVSLDKTQATFTGHNITPNVTVKNGSTVLKNGTDYTVTYSDNAKVGTAKVTVTGKGNYKGTVTKTFKILSKSLKYCNVTLAATQYTFNGQEIKPAVKIRIGENTPVYAGNYTVKYSNNSKAGTATVTITGKNNLTGTVTKTFKILPKSLKYCDVRLSGTSFKYTGKQIKPAVKVLISGKTIYSGNYKVTYKNNVNKGTATVTITGTGTCLQNSVTKTFKIV